MSAVCDLANFYVSRRRGFRGPRHPGAPVLLSLVLICAALAAPAVAQDRLERLEVSLWPEFDRPAMLVMMRAWVAADTPLPTTISLPMPAAAGTPSAVAYRAADGSMLVAQNVLTTEGDTIRVALTTPAPEIRLEYYVALDTRQPLRNYRFHWPGGIAIGEVSFDVVHPWGAVDVEVAPAGTRRKLPDGRIEERGRLGALTETDESTIDVRYTKPPGDPAAGGAVAQPAEPAPQGERTTGGFATADETQSDSRWLVLLVVATITFLCGFALGRRRKSP